MKFSLWKRLICALFGHEYPYEFVPWGNCKRCGMP